MSGGRTRSGKTDKVQDRDHDDNSSHEPNDAVHFPSSILFRSINGMVAKRFHTSNGNLAAHNLFSPRGQRLMQAHATTKRNRDMNTANPQLEGLYMALSGLNRLLVEKQLLTHEEIREMLSEVERAVMTDPKAESISASHAKAVAFPIRLLAVANEAAEKGANPTFEELARYVGQHR